MISAPTVTTDTTVTESFGLVQEGTAWFGPADTAVTLTVRVHAAVAPPRDGGTIEPDAGTPVVDAGSPVDDVPAVVDAASADTGTTARDAGTSRDVVVARDATAGADSGTAPISGGCGCRTSGSSRTGALGFVALSGLIALRSRRRRSLAR
jgi:MYXO-CTERM domain-containing protein